MYERSPDIEACVLKLYESMTNGDAEGFSHLIASDDSVLIVGTDAAEWWSGRDRVVDMGRQQADALRDSGFEVVPGAPQAYTKGDVGWFADHLTFRLPDKSEVATRITGTCVYESGDWKIVAAHISVGIPNEKVVGRELPT